MDIYAASVIPDMRELYNIVELISCVILTIGASGFP